MVCLRDETVDGGLEIDHASEDTALRLDESCRISIGRIRTVAYGDLVRYNHRVLSGSGFSAGSSPPAIG